MYDSVDVTAFGSTYKEILSGLGDAKITLAFFQDFAAAKVDATLWPLVGTTFPVTVKPTSAAVSTTNPRYDMTGTLLSYAPIAGAVGAASTTNVEIVNAASTGLTRNVT